MSEINQIRVPPRIDKLPIAKEEYQRGKPEGWRFTTDGNEFDFRQGKLFYNQQDFAKHLSENLTLLGAHYWTALSRRLGMYRDWATLNVDDPEALSKFFGLIHAFLTKIYGRIKRKFDETIDGISFHLEEGQLLINGVNVNACLTMVKKRKTKKGRIFLKGIRRRMFVLQENRTGHMSFEKIRDTVERLSAAIDLELAAHPDVIPLPPPAAQLKSGD